MAGMIDDMKDKMGGMGDEMRQRLDMLRHKEQDGSINDNERSELQELRSRMSQ